MCGRYTLIHGVDAIAEVFEVDVEGLEKVHEPRYNIAPTQPAPAIVSGTDGRVGGFLRWGLVPHWAEDLSNAARMINARSETVAERTAYKESFLSRRCLIPADGFYEWASGPGGKQPHWIYGESRGLFAFAGIWARWRSPGGERIHTFSILTREAPEDLSWLHDRVPLILDPAVWTDWLARGTDPDVLQGIMASSPHPPLRTHPVSKRVNHAAYDEPDCTEEVKEENPVDPQTRLF
ncbi:MAG: SOS response-associated peptidase [Gemmatimonadota bacterium]|nr:SOS response-associated peptidase [Gemmatimonadota bacterium]